MPTCIKHNQSYTMDEYCVYCGCPQTYTSTNTIQNLHPLNSIVENLSIKDVENILRKQLEQAEGEIKRQGQIMKEKLECKLDDRCLCDGVGCWKCA